MMTKEQRDEAKADAKAWAADKMECSRFEYRACRFNPFYIKINDKAGAFCGYYKPSMEGSKFILAAFGWGESPAEIYVDALCVYYPVLVHFDVLPILEKLIAEAKAAAEAAAAAAVEVATTEHWD